jgi:O-antigen biosynthesis protein WbqP
LAIIGRLERKITVIYRKIKRLLDILLSIIGMLILLPLFIVLILAIKLDSAGPVLFKQRRVGRNKKLFDILKFRTMTTDTPQDVPTHLLQDPERYITRVGRFLRKTSLDELPQIWNIFVGQMSIIGPRPALWNQLDLIAERDKYGANALVPGLTGWAQINGRDELPIEVKARYDGEYTRNISFGLDIRCFFGTISRVLKHEGVIEGGTGAIKSTDVHNRFQ